MKNRKLLAWFPAVVLFTAACRALIGLEEPQLGPDAGVDAGTDADANFDPTCIGVPLPEPPAAANAAEEGTYFLAVNGLFLDGFKKDFLDGGLLGQIPAANLDCSNTCGPALDAGDGAVTEVRPACRNPRAPAGNGISCDLPGTPGYENALFDAYGSFDLPGDGGITTTARLGESTIIIGLTGYNGLKDDSIVELKLASSTGLKRSGNACRGEDAGATDAGDAGVRPARLFKPQEDGCDEWEVSSNDFTTTSTVEQEGYARAFLGGLRGYVRDNYIVVPNTGTGVIPIIGKGFGLQYSRGFFVARLAWFKADGSPCTPGEGPGVCLLGTDEALTAGIVPFRSALEAFMAARPVSVDGILPRYCSLPETLYKNLLVDPLCRARDMTLDPNTWYKDAPCDALSAAIRFRARSAKPWIVRGTDKQDNYETFCPDSGAQFERFARCDGDGSTP
jgi:hypothetical protein